MVRKDSGIAHILLLLAAAGLIGFLLVTNSFEFRDKLFSRLFPKPPSHARDIISGDLRADIVIGQPDFSEINPGTVGNNNLWLPHGVIVDRNSTPNKMYIYDAGHNRILGYNLGTCLASTTNPLNCPADIVIGQPSFSTSACNGDSAFQNYPNRAPASASTLCGLQESQLSISEGGSGSSMAVDPQGNLYVTDFWNHRVLKYDNPFVTGNAVADDVWGQDDFTGKNCNKSATDNDFTRAPDATSLCFHWGNSNNWTAGVDVDSSGNVWVVDSGNNRVLRFPVGSKTADLVLGQPNFTSRSSGSSLNQLKDPSAVRINSSGRVYIADKDNNRVLIFDGSLVNGMNGQIFGSGFISPAGVDFDPTEPGRIWITDSGNTLLKLLDEGNGNQVKQIGRPNDGNLLGDTTGSLGIDSSGNIFVVIGKGDYSDEVLMFAKGSATNAPAKTMYWRLNNGRDDKGLYTASGVAVTNNQLIVSDYGRLMFWNNPASLTSGKSADGVAGLQVNSFTSFAPGGYGVLKADRSGHLWTAAYVAGDYPNRIEVFNLPLTMGASPIKTIGEKLLPQGPNTLQLLGGGQITVQGIYFGLVPMDDGNFLWVSEQGASRVFRIRDPLTNPVVDIILGQTDALETQCNQGGAKSTNTLCSPGSLSLDKLGNLYVSDHSLETAGNARLMVFNRDLLPADNTSVIYAPAASKIFDGIATWESAFDSTNRMVVGFNPYFPNSSLDSSHPGGWFPGVYNDPLTFNPVSASNADSYLNDYYSQAFAATFDDLDNLYVSDLNRARVLIYKNPFNITHTPTPTTIPTSTPTAAPTPTPTPVTVTPGAQTIVISKISASTTGNSATIKWTTNIPSTSKVDYGTTASLGSSTALDSTLVTKHSVTVTGLNRQTTYYFKVTSGITGSQTTSSIQQLRTKNR